MTIRLATSTIMGTEKISVGGDTMPKKAVALVTTVAFLVSLNACIPIKKNARTDPAKLHGAESFDLTVVAVQKKTGERLEFSKKDLATVSGGSVLVPDPGGAVPPRLAWDDIKGFRKNENGLVNFAETKDGRAFRVLLSGTYDKGILLGRGFAYRSIPLSDLDLVWVRKTNWPMTVTVNLLAAAAVVTAAGLVALSQADWNLWEGAESCPFVYSFDGEQYVLDAEPYGGAVCPGLERVDWVGLDNLKPMDGRYRLLLANELEEVEHVDEVKLVVVDHPEGVVVVPELSGRMRTVALPRPPASARDGEGRDILPLLSSKDATFWVGRVEGRDPENDDDLKDELVVEFAKPAGARSAKLVANAWWTQWGTQAIKPILATQGRELGSFFDRIDSEGPTRFSVMRWFAREEMYNLQVRVETGTGWKTKALIFGGGPMIAKDKAYALDLSDVPGDTVRLKLTPAAGFWMIDRLALDFSEDAPVRVTELAAVSARDAAGRNVGAELASDDGAYFVIPKGAGPATLEFAVPTQAPGSARSFFVKAAGYYDLMLNGDGERTLDLDEVMNNPGETIRLALRTHPALSRPSPRTVVKVP
jgi:hypothetical protein